jgi:hypothetical protein
VDLRNNNVKLANNVEFEVLGGVTEECDLLGCNAVQFGTTSQMFLRNVSTPSSDSKSKPSKKLATRRRPSHSWFLAWFPLRPWKWKKCVPLKGQWTSDELYGVTIQTIVILNKFVCYLTTLSASSIYSVYVFFKRTIFIQANPVLWKYHSKPIMFLLS